MPNGIKKSLITNETTFCQIKNLFNQKVIENELVSGIVLMSLEYSAAWINYLLKLILEDELSSVRRVDQKPEGYKHVKLINGYLHNADEEIRDESVEFGTATGIAKTIKAIRGFKDKNILMFNLESYPFFDCEKWNGGYKNIIRFSFLMEVPDDRDNP